MFLSALSAACGQHIRFPERLKNLRKNFILQYPEYLSVGQTGLSFTFFPGLNDLNDLSDICALTLCGTWLQFILMQAIARTIVTSCKALCENRAVIKISEFACWYCKRSATRMVEQKKSL